jgi:putative restriction endonuclease
MLADAALRQAAFAFLDEQVARHGHVLSLDVLKQGFEFEGARVKLLGPQGIFKPAAAEIPLSITTAPQKRSGDRPYDDQWGADGLQYRYRGDDPDHRENVGLRKAMSGRVPLIYFHGVVPGRYFASYPVFVVGDDRGRLTFTVAVDDSRYLSLEPGVVAEAGAEARRAYITAVTRKRLHQDAFRVRVLAAYRQCCALCRLRHEELLDAAHIIPDSDPRGVPVVPNGIALCKLHHAAFDQQLIGIRPDGLVHVRADILEEIDGPMLIHALQGMHDKPIIVPKAARDRPNPDFLADRYAKFLKAG